MDSGSEREKSEELIGIENGDPYVHSAWNTLCAQEDGTIKIYNPVDGSYYQYDAVNDTVIRTMRQKSKFAYVGGFSLLGPGIV